MFRLELTLDKKEYEDYFTIERVVEGGKGTETLFIIPFKTVRSLTYLKSSDDVYTICLDVPDGDPRLKHIQVRRHCFNYFSFRKMVKLLEKSKAASY